ncbi:unnamed protein product [Kuraishia capsulata CBS 1993]|uniref:Exportin-T n=1 Tax=Kuraishia capsulata CBS 1993 TaxID=1382522 RepID=W6MKN9_9ASCO|nr:uncharacterized protein KUCA_T00003021001 [Kuraishia capsulata CBS 1993]CDK27044.1 unnamed protein product [Kuraishia capsulata CBS 1993]
MDQQIRQAVDILLSATNDQALKQQAFDFIGNLKTSDDGWEHCLTLLNRNEPLPDELKFFAIQVVQEKLTTQLTQDQLVKIKEYLISYLKLNLSSQPVAVPFLRNALAKALGLLFCRTYTSFYPEFLKDFLSMIKTGSGFNDLATDYYLRVLLFVHSEIGDHLIIKEKETAEISNQLKDAIRALDVVNLTTSWKQILTHYTQTQIADTELQQTIIENTITVVGNYISWIEINLILDEEYLRLLFQFFNSSIPAHVITTASAFVEIMAKKMPAVKKLELLNLLNLTPLISNVNTNNFDVLMALAKLTNALGCESVRVLDTASVDELRNEAFKTSAFQQVLGVFPLMFKFLENEFDDISVEVFPFIQDFLLFLKKNITNDEIDFSTLNNAQIVSALYEKIIIKMKYDEDDDGEDDDDVEIFNEVRSRLVAFQNSIFVLDESLSLRIITNCINESLFNHIDDSNKDWRTTELGLFELSQFSDILKNNIMNLPKTMLNTSGPYEAFHEMLCKLVDNSEKILVNHPLIQLLFFELVVKHSIFFTNSAIQVEGIDKLQVLLKVLKIFVSNFGVFCTLDKVKLRSWFLFLRFIRLTKPKIDDYILEELIRNLLPLLEIKVNGFTGPVKPDYESSTELLNAVDGNNFEHQAYLFESVGLLISLVNGDKSSDKLRMLELVLQPLFADLEKCINAGGNKGNLLISVEAYHCLVAIGTILNGYELSPGEGSQIMPLLEQISQVVLITLENFVDDKIVRGATRFAVIRIFLLLIKINEFGSTDKALSDKAGALLEAILQKFISLMMVNFDKASFTEMSEFINFISQISHYCFNYPSVYQMLDSLLTPFFEKIFLVLKERGSTATQEDIRDLFSVRMTIAGFVIYMCNNHLASLYLTTANKALLTTLINTLLNYCIEGIDIEVTTDVGIQLVKQSLAALTALIGKLGSGIINDPLDLCHKIDGGSGSRSAFEQVNDVLINNSIILVFEIAFKHKLRDSQQVQQVKSIAMELTRLLRAIVYIGYIIPPSRSESKKKKVVNDPAPNGVYESNQMMVQQLHGYLTSQMGFPVEMANEFVQNLLVPNESTFGNYFARLIVQSRT